MLKQSSGAQALKDQKDRLDEIVLSIRAELAAVELDAKAPKQLKERTKTLLEKVAKLKLKVRKSPFICNLSPVCLLCTVQRSWKVLMLDTQMHSATARLPWWHHGSRDTEERCVAWTR